MSKVLLLGAGRSVWSLVKYLKHHALTLNLELRIGDINISEAEKLASIIPGSTYFEFDILSDQSLALEVKAVDLVISMLPAHLHGRVAESCLAQETHLLTASYVHPQIKGLNNEVEKKGLLFLMECGLDPGIDHMSAMKEIHEIKHTGANIISFKSFTGGLIAPESDNNPWNYKFTWNPRNVVLAGQGTVKFIRNGKYKYIPYTNLFNRLESVSFKSVGAFEAYANRDSLKYIDLYNLTNCPTVFRGTLRRPGFAKAWGLMVKLGLTDDSYLMASTENLTNREYLNSFLVYHPYKTVEEKFMDKFNLNSDSDEFKKFKWLGLFDDTKVSISKGTPAQIIQSILENKWILEKEDKDMVVMQHQIEYELNNKVYKKISSLVLKGDNHIDTSMSKTVGLPLGIAAKNILLSNWDLSGVHIPNKKIIYEAILSELKELGIYFHTHIIS